MKKQLVATMQKAVVTPAKAKQYLTDALPNRREKDYHITAIVRAIESGDWVLNGDAIRFLLVRNKPRMFDGGNRAKAIIRAGQPIETYLFTTNDERILYVTDTNRVIRSDSDLLAFLPEGKVFKDPRRAVVIANSMWRFSHAVQTGRRYFDERLRFMLEHKDNINKTCEEFPTIIPGITISPVYAAFAKALYHEELEALLRFAKLLKTGEYGEGEKTGIVLRENVLFPNARPNGKKEPRDLIYRKCVNAIQAFCARRELSLIKAVSGDPYPLPE